MEVTRIELFILVAGIMAADFIFAMMLFNHISNCKDEIIKSLTEKEADNGQT